MDIDRIKKIQDNSKSNEAQEIVNSKIKKEIDDIKGDIAGKQGTKVYIGDSETPINSLFFNADHATSGNTTITVINCGTSEDVGGS